MFLCPKCHDSACPDIAYEGRSNGRCEDCGQSAICYDCHSYGLPADAERKPPKKILKKGLN